MIKKQLVITDSANNVLNKNINIITNSKQYRYSY